MGAGDETEDAVFASLRDFMDALWKKLNLDEGSNEAIEAELRKLLKEQVARYAPDEASVDAFVEEAIALIHDTWKQYDPDGETGRAILVEIQSLMKRLYEKYGQDGADDEGLVDDLKALMHELWQKYGPDSEINKAFTAEWKALMAKYGIATDLMDAFTAEMNAMLEEMWKKYGPEGEDNEALMAWIKSLWSSLGAMGEEGIGKWLSSLFTAQSKPVSNSAPVTAVAASNSRVSRLSSAAGIQSNDYDASVTVITKNEVCLSFVTGVNQTRQGVDGVSVRLRDATKPDAPLSQYTSKNGGLVILPSNLFVADKYDEVHLYVEVDPRQ